jgi:hypothetical protein
MPRQAADKSLRVRSFMQTHLIPDVVHLCKLWTTRKAVEEPSDDLVRNLVESGCIDIDDTSVLHTMLRGTLPCLRYILSHPDASRLPLPPGMLGWCLESTGDCGRMECIVEFWEKCPHIDGLRDVAAETLARLPAKLTRAEALLRRVAAATHPNA